MLRRKYRAICVPLEVVRRDYFPNLKMPSLLRNLREKRILLRVVVGDWGGVRQRVVYMHDLADFFDRQAGLLPDKSEEDAS
ncbi:pyocin activator PrtN family protein [Pseudomonas chlororaphis]|uniref:pyocin activator PrtN family protein n=1 Tax=Pseudomonas chlororaphis TaxID=587753 RepID=UPI003B8A82C1